MNSLSVSHSRVIHENLRFESIVSVFAGTQLSVLLLCQSSESFVPPLQVCDRSYVITDISSRLMKAASRLVSSRASYLVSFPSHFVSSVLRVSCLTSSWKGLPSHRLFTVPQQQSGFLFSRLGRQFDLIVCSRCVIDSWFFLSHVS